MKEPPFPTDNELIKGSNAGFLYCGKYTAPRLGNFFLACPFKTHFKFARPVAPKNQMGVAIDEPRRDPRPAAGGGFLRQHVRVAMKVCPRTEPRNAPVFYGQRGVSYCSVRRTPRSPNSHSREVAINPKMIPDGFRQGVSRAQNESVMRL